MNLGKRNNFFNKFLLILLKQNIYFSIFLSKCLSITNLVLYSRFNFTETDFHHPET